MKHLILLSLLLSSVSCKNTNQTSLSRASAFESRAYLSVPHAKDQSLLRRKLLNLSLNQIVPTVLDQSSVPVYGDEFKLDQALDYALTDKEERDYKSYQKNCAELIVSYQNRIEIYFVPMGSDRLSVVAQLGLKPEDDGKFFWVGRSERELQKGAVYYLVSANVENLKENDIHFFQTTNVIGNNFEQKVLTFKKSQNIELHLQINYLTRVTTMEKTTGSPLSCSSDMREAGMCAPCDYQIETSTSQYNKGVPADTRLFDAEILIDGKTYPLSEFKQLVRKNNEVVIPISLRHYSLDETVTVEVKPMLLKNQLKQVLAENIGDANCRSKRPSAVIDITPKLDSILALTIMGRELNEVSF